MQAEHEPDHERAERWRQLREQVAGLERQRPHKLRRRKQVVADPELAAGGGREPRDAHEHGETLKDQVVPIAPLPSAGEWGEADELVSTGCAALDHLLARRGLERGSLVEWLSPGRGGAAGTLAWLVAREAARQGGGIVVVDRQRRFYPPAALAWGVDPRSLAVVRVENDEDELWVVDQALRSPAVAAVWLHRDELSTRDFRRWQLAAERGGTLGLLVRPASVQGQPTWADVRWQVQPVSAQRGRVWRLHVELVRCRGGLTGQQLEVELDDVSGVLREAPAAPRSMDLQARER